MAAGEVQAGSIAGRRRLMAAGLIGNVLEWYDFAVYGYFAATIGSLFFPAEDRAVSLIASFGAFAIGFVMRPVGSVVFGHIGDRIGRKRMMVASVMAMAVSTCAIGLLPTHAQIGVAAPVLIIVLRMIQGLSVGGEYVGSGVFLAESAPTARRAFWSGFSTAGLFSGLILGSVVGALIAAVLAPEQVSSWGWRLPFLSGLLLGAVALILRLSISEPPAPAERSTAPLIEAFSRYSRRILHAMVLIAGPAAGWYAATVYLPGWMVETKGLAKVKVLEINAISMAGAIAAGFAAAAVSDRIGRKPVLIFASLCLAVLYFPVFLVFDSGSQSAIFAGQALLVALTGCFAFVLPSALSEMFPWRVRVTSANVSLNLSFAIFGGTSPMIAAWVISKTNSVNEVGLYLSILCFVSAVACFTLQDRRGADLSE